MNDNSAKVAEILLRTLEPNAELRRNAERELRTFEQVPGFANLLLQLACSEQCAAEIRMASAVGLKNFVKVNWGEAPEVEIPDEEQGQLRGNILSAMFATSGNLQKQLSHAVFLIAKRDFPSRWEDLVDGLAAQLGSDDFDKLSAALFTMDQLFMKYRYEHKSAELWKELKMCLIAVQAPLTLLYEKMLEYAKNVQTLSSDVASQLFDLLTSIVKLFHSLCVQELPEFFEDNLATWMNGILQLLQCQAPQLQSGAGEPTSLDKLKTEICEVVTLYAQRYEEEVQNHMEGLLSTIWQLLANTGSETRYDSCVWAALDFLTAICQRTQYEDLFVADGVLQTLTTDVVVKNLVLRQEDMELFEDEPLEYMKKDIEGTDAGTRRRGAVDFLRALCARFETSLVPILSSIVTDFLSDRDNWTKSDVVYCMVRAMASRTETARSGTTSTSQLVKIGDFYVSQVRSDLENGNAHPILKADALKFVVLFRNQLPPDVLFETLLAIENLLASQHAIIHKYAAYALERLLLVQVSKTPLFNSSNVPAGRLLTKLISAFDADSKAQNSAYLIKAVMRVMAVIDSSIVQNAGEIASRLSQMVEGVTRNPADPVHTHFLFETICILVKKTSGLVSGGIDQQLFPLIESILSQEVADLIPYALQVTGLLLSECHARGGSTDAYLAFLPFLLRAELWQKSANIPAALLVLDSYVRIHPQRVLAEHSVTIVQHFSRLIASKNLDNYGFMLASTLIPSIEHMSGVENPVATVFNHMFRRVQFSRTAKFAKLFVVFFFRFIVIRGAQAVLQALESIQSGMYRMVVEKVVGPEIPKLADSTTQQEKRICIIGLADMLDGTLPSVMDLFGSLAEAGISLCEGTVLMGQHLTAEEEQAAMYSEDGEFNNQYCKLSNAAPPDRVRPEIVNWKKYLAEVILRRIAVQQPAALECLPAHVRQTLEVYNQLT